MKRGQMLRFSDPAALDAHLHAKGGHVPAPLESEIQTQVLEVLAIHPKVAWRFRMNTGGAWFKGQYVKYGFKGMADITGQLRDGRRLEIELKRPGEKPDDDQQKFLDAVNGAGGFAFVARSVADVMRALEKA